ncbi:hypothetical protein ACHIPZ_18365 [Antrihabitans sp. NCIMB 15449]|uniref:Uncharacterized protein n=1 Tax=Antrihabitans spumae TaxID=3373370 RepID=A0ABW7JQ75_9NOCA
MGEKRVQVTHNGVIEWMSEEDAAKFEAKKQTKRTTRISWLALAVATLSALFAWDSSSGSLASARYSSNLPCVNYRTVVFNLYDRGLDAGQIAAVLNLEQISFDSKGEKADPGPAYDNLYKDTCGKIEDVVVNLRSTPSQPGSTRSGSSPTTLQSTTQLPGGQVSPDPAVTPVP